MRPNNSIEFQRGVVIAGIKEQIKIPRPTYQLLTKLVEIKQTEVLSRFFYIPLWRACTATLVLLIIILFLSGAWVFPSALIFVCGFSMYMTHKSRSYLKRIRLQLSGYEAVEISRETISPEKTAPNPQNSGEGRKE